MIDVEIPAGLGRDFPLVERKIGSLVHTNLHILPINIVDVRWGVVPDLAIPELEFSASS